MKKMLIGILALLFVMGLAPRSSFAGNSFHEGTGKTDHAQKMEDTKTSTQSKKHTPWAEGRLKLPWNIGRPRRA